LANSESPAYRFKRAALKLSGEILQGDKGHGIDHAVLGAIADQISELSKAGVELTIVPGGGNIFRGLSGVEQGVDRICGDHMGMMATVLNGLALSEALQTRGCQVKLFSALEIEAIGESFSSERAIGNLETGGINIVVAGTGHPYFTTDTAGVLRALETNSEVLLKATRVDGVYDRDPEKYSDAKFYHRLTYMEAVNKNLRVMDLTATSLCRDNNLPVIVFNLKKSGNLKAVVKGEKVGTLIEGEDKDA